MQLEMYSEMPTHKIVYCTYNLALAVLFSISVSPFFTMSLYFALFAIFVTLVPLNCGWMTHAF